MFSAYGCCHVFNKSIAGYEIFRDEKDYLRMLGILDYYRFSDPPVSFSVSLDYPLPLAMGHKPRQELIRILAFCLMPTHFHLVIELMRLDASSDYLNVCLNAYSRYFNLRYGRKGPLWQGRTRKVSVGYGEAFLHVTRYVHLNPVTAYLVNASEDWAYSSYGVYAGKGQGLGTKMVDKRYSEMSQGAYHEFVAGYKEKQREHAKFKKLFLE